MSLSGRGITTNLWPADRCHLLTCILSEAVSLRLGTTIRHLSGRCWKGFHGVRGQGHAATVMEVCELESSWKTDEWIWTKTCTNTYCTWETNWLGSQGDGFKGQGHRNVCWRRIAVEDLVKIHFVAQILGKKCMRFENDSRYRQGPSNDCYVAFPRLNQGASRTWYHARRNCWYFGGDLAPSRAVLNIASLSWPGKGNFSIGLQRDEYVWDNTGGTCYRHFNSFFRVAATCWLLFLQAAVQSFLKHEMSWNKYMNEWINEWINEWVSEWINRY